MKLSIKIRKIDLLMAYLVETNQILLIVNIFLLSYFTFGHSSISFSRNLLFVLVLYLLGNNFYSKINHALYKILGIKKGNIIELDIKDQKLQLIGKNGSVTINIDQIEKINKCYSFYYIYMKENNFRMVIPEKQIGNEFVERYSYLFGK